MGAQPVTDRDWDDAHLINAAIDIHHDDPGFGYRFIADELARQGVKAGENRVARLCSQERIWAAFTKKRGLSRKPGPAVHDDLVERDFTAVSLDELWFTDITEHPTSEGKLYLCAIKDACSTRIVGYAMADRMTAQLAVTALRSAIARALTGRHADHPFGPGFAISFARLRPHGARPPAVRLDGPGRQRAPTTRRWNRSSRCCRRTSSTANAGRRRDELRLAIITWIERTYHRRRRQRGLGRLTPIEFEMILSNLPKAA